MQFLPRSQFDAAARDEWHAILHAVRCQLDLMYATHGGQSREEALLRDGVERIKRAIAQIDGPRVLEAQLDLPADQAHDASTCIAQRLTAELGSKLLAEPEG